VALSQPAAARQSRGHVTPACTGRVFKARVAQNRGLDLLLVVRRPDGVAELEAGTVTPDISATYPLDHVRQAMSQLAAGQARGKIAITI
jgi:hypothetical protein